MKKKKVVDGVITLDGKKLQVTWNADSTSTGKAEIETWTYPDVEQAERVFVTWDHPWDGPPGAIDVHRHAKNERKENKMSKSAYKQMAEALVREDRADLEDHKDDLRTLIGKNVEFEDDKGVIRMGTLTNLAAMGGRVEYGKQQSALVSLTKIARIGTWT